MERFEKFEVKASGFVIDGEGVTVEISMVAVAEELLKAPPGSNLFEDLLAPELPAADAAALTSVSAETRKSSKPRS